MQPGSWAALVGMRGWDPREYTERTVGSLLAELVTEMPGQLPISARFSHPATVYALPVIIRFFRAHGYRFVRV